LRGEGKRGATGIEVLEIEEEEEEEEEEEAAGAGAGAGSEPRGMASSSFGDEDKETCKGLAVSFSGLVWMLSVALWSTAWSSSGTTESEKEAVMVPDEGRTG
jgi:hypothetical protein